MPLNKFSSNFNRKVISNAVVILILIVILEVTLLFSFSKWLSGYLLENAALYGAIDYTEVITAARRLYASEVVERLSKDGVKVLPDYLKHKGAVPLPATLTIELGKKLRKNNPDLIVDLYSDFPFPWREPRALDDFQYHALNELRANPYKPYYRTESHGGRKFLRYAIADRMSASCIACHNSHPQSPKKDWKLGDVRGVLEVSRPIEYDHVASRALSFSGALISLVSILGLGGVIVVFRALSVRNRQLAEAVQTRDDFISIAAHDLKSPLSSLLMNIQLNKELAQEQDASLLHHEKLHEVFKKFERQIKRSVLLVNNLFDVTRISSRQLLITRAPVNLSETVQGVLDQFYEDIVKSGSRIITKLDPQVTGHWDPFRVIQIISNLLSNALKFGEGKPIEIEVAKTETGALFRIRDYGAGIPESEQSKIFEKFKRADRANQLPGLGLGLFIVRAIVRAHGGTIHFVSRETEGSTFTVELPNAT